MNLAGLQASFARNKTPFLLAGAGLVGVLAWRARTAKTTATGAGAPLAAGTSAYPSTTSAGYTSTGSGPYSSGAWDVYSAIQPQLEAIGNTQAQLKDMLGQTQTPPIPVPAAPPSTPSYASDPRRAAIASYYQEFLGRAPDLAGLNAQDASGLPLAQIRQNILTSPEAKAVK